MSQIQIIAKSKAQAFNSAKEALEEFQGSPLIKGAEAKVRKFLTTFLRLPNEHMLDSAILPMRGEESTSPELDQVFKTRPVIISEEERLASIDPAEPSLEAMVRFYYAYYDFSEGHGQEKVDENTRKYLAALKQACSK